MPARPSALVNLLLALSLASASLADLPISLAPRDRDEAALLLFEADRPYRVSVALNEGPDTDRLFDDLPSTVTLHPAYEATVALCEEFDPHSDEGPDPARVDEYLSLVANTGPIFEALFAAGERNLEGLRQTWFGPGQGFEHVFCGDNARGTKLGGYHYWYTHYAWERRGKARYLGVNYGKAPDDAGMADDRIVTGGFGVDFDGPAGQPPAAKSIGGFTVGHSPMALLALGHLAGLPGATPLNADLNGKVYRFVVHDHLGSLRTLYPVFE